MKAMRMAVGAVTIGAATLLAVPGIAAAGLSDALPDLDVHVDVAELVASVNGDATDVTFSPPTAPANTTCYGPYVYTGKLDSKIDDIASGFLARDRGDADADSDGDGAAGADAEAAADEAIDDAVDDAAGGDANKVPPEDDDPSTRVRPGGTGTLSFDLDGAPYTALATCVTGGTVPDGDGAAGATDSQRTLRGAVYLRAINYDFGVAGQLLGSLDSGSLGSIGDLGFDGFTGSLDKVGDALGAANE